MSANVDAMVREGVNAYRTGKHEEARALLFKAVELDDQHEQAWLWLSAVVDSVEDQQTCLENVLTINPHNERARQGLSMLTQRAAGAIGTPPAVRAKATSELPPIDLNDDDAFAAMSFTDPAPAPSASPGGNPFTAPIEEEELPSSVDWGTTETSSASTYRAVNEPTPVDYDNWVAGLNLNSNSLLAEEDELPALDHNPFTSTARDDLFGFDEEPLAEEDTLADDDDVFVGGPFDTSFDFEEPAPAPQPTSSRSKPVMSPVEEKFDPLLSDIEADELDDFDLIEDYDDMSLGAVDPSEYFKSIPAEIKATRLPGSKEGLPILLILSMIILLVVNIGAVGLLLTTLTSG